VADIRKVVLRGAAVRRSPARRRSSSSTRSTASTGRSRDRHSCPTVEDGTIILIGATTGESLLRRERDPSSPAAGLRLRPLADAARGSGCCALASRRRGARARPPAGESPRGRAARPPRSGSREGTPRTALNALELAFATTPPDPADGKHTASAGAEAEQSIQQRALRYDREGDEHYDTVSAFIKSVRGSDPDAALYWARRRCLAPGRTRRCVLRRLVIRAGAGTFASPTRWGSSSPTPPRRPSSASALPGGDLPIRTQATLYLATGPKEQQRRRLLPRASAGGAGGADPVAGAPAGVQTATAAARPRRGLTAPPRPPGPPTCRTLPPGRLCRDALLPARRRGYEAKVGRGCERWRRAVHEGRSRRRRGRGRGSPRGRRRTFCAGGAAGGNRKASAGGCFGARQAPRDPARARDRPRRGPPVLRRLPMGGDFRP